MVSVLPNSPGLRAAFEIADGVTRFGRGLRAVVVAAAARTGSLLVSGPVSRRVYLGPLHARSAALRGARVMLHGVRPAPAPVGVSRDSQDFYYLYVTVRVPVGRSGRAWDPKDLTLVGADAREGRPEEDVEAGTVFGAGVWRKGRFEEERESLRLLGTHRLRLRVALRSGVRSFRFRYFLELLRRQPPPQGDPSARSPLPVRYIPLTRPARIDRIRGEATSPRRLVARSLLDRFTLGLPGPVLRAWAHAPWGLLSQGPPGRSPPKQSFFPTG